VVCSNFHRGKIAVLFEPNLSQFASIGSDLKINKQFIRIVDIQETHTFDLRVNWASYRSWLKVGTADSAFVNNDMMLNNNGNSHCNGCLVVTPFTELQSPDGSDVEVNVYVHCDNLQVNGMTGINMYNERKVISEPGLLNFESGEVSARSTQSISLLDLNPSSASQGSICEEYFGEQILSFRAALKRYQTTRRMTFNLASANTNQFVLNIFPPSRLPYGGTATPIEELYTYLRYAYLGYRGSLRYLLSICPQSGFGQGQASIITRASLYSPSTQQTEAHSSSTSAHPAYLEGTVTMSNTTAGFQFEFPCYMNNLFGISCSETNDDELPLLDIMEHHWFRALRITFSGASLANNCVFTTDQASGEDFTFLRFLGAPYYTRTTVE
jgi:hypothetical protein